MQKDPDMFWWQRAQQGDQSAFDYLQNKYRSLVVGSIKIQLAYINRDDLDALANEIWLAVWKALPNFRGEAMFTTWLVGIIKRKGFSWLRDRDHEARTAVVIEQELRAPEAEMSHEAQTILRVDVDHGMQQLNQKEREVIHMRYYRRLTDEEIAQCLDLPLGTVKSRIKAGLAHLRKWVLEGDLKGGEVR